MKIALCTPTLKEPTQGALYALKMAEPALKEAGYDVETICQQGSPYISWARSQLARVAFRPERGAEAIVYLDDDVSYDPPSLLRLLEAEGDVVCGTYRFKQDDEKYMGAMSLEADGGPRWRDDGCLAAISIPAGFLKITRTGYDRFARNYPQFVYSDMGLDLFNHGAHGGVWWGEDCAFSRNWRERCGEIWVVPNLDLAHHERDTDKAYPGNYRRYLDAHPEEPAPVTYGVTV